MKRLQSQGMGTKSKQAEPLTEQEDELLWERGLLGESCLQTLRDTIILLNGL